MRKRVFHQFLPWCALSWALDAAAQKQEACEPHVLGSRFVRATNNKPPQYHERLRVSIKNYILLYVKTSYPFAAAQQGRPTQGKEQEASPQFKPKSLATMEPLQIRSLWAAHLLSWTALIMVIVWAVAYEVGTRILHDAAPRGKNDP